MILREVGSSVDCVGTTTEAEAALTQTMYCGMLLDYHLPGEDGVRFLQRYRGAAALPPTFIITRHDIAPLQRMVDHPAVKHILAKPMEFVTIFMLARQYFGQGADLHDPDEPTEDCDPCVRWRPLHALPGSIGSGNRWLLLEYEMVSSTHHCSTHGQ